MTSGRFDPASNRFVRISRSANVNIESVKELDPRFHGEYMITLRNGTHVTLTRSYREQLRQLGVMTQAGWSWFFLLEFSGIPPLTGRNSPLESRNVSLIRFALTALC